MPAPALPGLYQLSRQQQHLNPASAGFFLPGARTGRAGHPGIIAACLAGPAHASPGDTCPPMQLLTIGLNHQTAPLALREQLAFPSERIGAALQSLRERLRDRVPEAAILSTCNRTEIYCADQGAASRELQHDMVVATIREWLSEFHGLPAERIAPHLYAHLQSDAVRHAFRVASGLDSMVLGEPQILGQMKQAARDADAAGALGSHLHQLFQRTFAVAKEVRSNTEIGAHSVSMAAAAVRLAQRIFGRVAEQHVLCIGAGEMIELMATHFAAQQPKSLVIANRTLERGERLAARFSGRAIRLADLPEQLPQFDIVISCTASSLPIIGLGLMQAATRARRHRPVFVVDLAVPRDVEPEVGKLDDVFLYTVDDLGKLAAAAMENRQAAVSQAEAIIETQVQRFMHWLDERQVVPAIRELHARGAAIREAELERARRMLARGDTPDTVLEALAHGLTAKFLHGPTQLLHHPEEARHTPLTELVPQLFKTGK